MQLTAMICWALMPITLPRVVTDAVAIPLFVYQLDSKDANERRKAAYELCDRGESAAVAVPKLVQLLAKDPDVDVRIAAAYGLSYTGQKDKAAVPALVEALKKDPENDVRLSVASCLGGMGASAKDAIPALIGVLEDRDPNMRSNAAAALGHIGPDQAGVNALVGLLKDSDRGTRQNAVFSLGQSGQNRDAVRALETALEDKSPIVRVVAAIGLLKGKPQKKAPYVVLVRAIKSEGELKDPEVKVAYGLAGQFLVNVNEKSVSMMTALIDALADNDPRIRYSAAHTLAMIGRPAKAAETALKIALKDDNARVREYAADALEKINPPEKAPKP
jgi:HEAT repeat protein